MHYNTVTTEAITLQTLSVMSSRNLAMTLLEEPSDFCQEVVTFKKVKSPLCALICVLVSVYLLVSVCLYSQTRFITSCGTGCQRGL